MAEGFEFQSFCLIPTARSLHHLSPLPLCRSVALPYIEGNDSNQTSYHCNHASGLHSDRFRTPCGCPIDDEHCPRGCASDCGASY